MLIMDKIWSGIFPCEDFLTNDSNYRRCAKESLAQHEALIAKLDADNKQALEELLSQKASLEFMEQRDAFAMGMRMGAMLMMDVFCQEKSH